jgi:hypothetical protein
LTVPVLNSENVIRSGLSRPTTTVVLNDLVVGALCTSTADRRGTRGLFDSNGILTDAFEPHVSDGARTLAVDALGLVGSDDNVPGNPVPVSR